MDAHILYCDDNLARLATTPAESVDLIYLDPPFFSNKTYEVVWGDEAEVRSFEDRWEGGIRVYVEWMRDRAIEMHRVLKPTGSLFLHCDWHASHYLRIMLDGIFGDTNLQNELIWFYKGGGSSKKRWSRKHDTVFWYTKGKQWTFNLDEVRTSYSQTILARPKSSYRNHHYGSKDDPRAVTTDWDLNPKGKRPDDVIEMPILNPGARERLGYPTQKPEALIEIFVKAASNRGDVILDPFCGCGTTVAVAERLKRQWIGIDISPTAISIIQARMAKLGVFDIPTVGMPVGEDHLRELGHYAFQNWVIQRVNGTHSPRKSGDMGIDGFSFMEHHPIQVKQSSNVERNVVDNFETAIRRAERQKGFIVAFSFTKGAKEEVARARGDGLDIHLVTVSQLIGDKSDLRPAAEQMIADLMPAARPSAALPTAEDLMRSAAKIRSGNRA